MFVKKKPNRSGSTTVVVAEKEKGATKYLKTIGTSSNPANLAEYAREDEDHTDSQRQDERQHPDEDPVPHKAATTHQATV